MNLAAAREMWEREDVAVAPGVEVALFRAGRRDAAATTVLLVHGLGHWTKAAWDAIAARLSLDYRVVGFDLPGFGESAKPDVGYDLPFFTRALDAVVRHLDVPRLVLVGHSLGGLIAASYAAGAPDRVALLALIGPAGFRTTPRLWLYALGSAPAAWAFGLRPSRALVRHVLAGAAFDPASISEAVHERAFALARDPAYVRACARVYAGSLPHLLRRRALHARLARYRGPVLLFWGRFDRYVPIAALARARRVYPHAEVTVLERSGHIPNVEEPDVIVDRLRRTVR